MTRDEGGEMLTKKAKESGLDAEDEKSLKGRGVATSSSVSWGTTEWVQAKQQSLLRGPHEAPMWSLQKIVLTIDRNWEEIREGIRERRRRSL